MAVILGAIADDFTGATDLANTLVLAGMRCIQAIGIPAADFDPGPAEAVVVALKSRSAPREAAIAGSLAALARLREIGARQILFKYCSTFDSTPDGNIGPVAEALRAALQAGITLVCPAFPAAGRTVYQGYLFVGSTLLSESPMKDHPLTPMHDSSLVRLMQAQCRGRVGLASRASVAAGPERLEATLRALDDDGVQFAVVDAICDDDLMTIGAVAARHPLVTGGSGVAMGLPRTYRAAGLLGDPVHPEPPAARGRAAVLAGSSSQATRDQIACVASRWPSRRLDPVAFHSGACTPQDLVDWAAAQNKALPVVIFASAAPDEVAKVQERLGREAASTLIEQAFGEIATGLVARGFDRLVVAGGETSGAVVSALGLTGLRIGPEICPGVPWTEPADGPAMALALKSGNFGGAAFFADALEGPR
jgi:uncharacterized protein YgbK (DUF1537 family)